MARKPADVIAKSNKPYGRDAIWTAIRKLASTAKDATFTCRDIFDACGHEVKKGTIKTYVNGLTNAGYLTTGIRTPGAFFEATKYRLSRNVGAEAPRVRKDGSEVTQGLGTEAMWRTMKTLNAFTAAELALAASTSKAQVAETAAADYLKFMIKAGFVRAVAKGAPGKPARMAFIRARDPGPKPPQIQRIKQVFDPNSNTVVWPKSEITKGGAR